ncbi:cell division protein SepF [Candidatus Woesearchaeota archaeon]|nr:cell division protein SepF [Candidatus Woesearchaeota archaeon]
MKKLLKKFTGMFSSPEDYEEVEEKSGAAEGDYVEIDSDSIKKAKKKVLVKTYFLDDFEDVKGILDDLREGETIALVNIKPLKEKDIIELKRAINKLKKTCDAIEGEIAGFGEDYIVVVPGFAKIHRSKQTSEVKEDAKAQ